jgi:hypothetical protein
MTTFDFDFKSKSDPSEVLVMFAPTVSALDAPSAISATGPAAVIAPEVVTLEPVEVIDTSPSEDVRVAPLAVVIELEPERVILPELAIAASMLMLPPASSVNPLLAAAEVTLACTLIAPVDSTRVENVSMCFSRSSSKMLAVPEVFDSKTPPTKSPSVDPLPVMFTALATNVGVTSRLVPTNESDVNVSA